MKIDVLKQEKLTLIEVDSGALKVTVCDLGASFYGVKYHNDEMILRVKNQDDFLLPNLYFGKTIGRVCGRTSINPFEIYDQKYKLQDNDNGASLHGGLDGLSNKIFHYEIREDDGTAIVTFSYLSKDGEAGYPGNLLLKVIYSITKNQINVKFLATTDAPCLISLTNHAYFNLGESSVEELSLQLSSKEYVVFDEKAFPLKTQEVKKKWDFSNGKSLSETGEIDNYFIFDNEKELTLKSSKYKLNIKTDFLGVQLYTDNYVSVEATSSEQSVHRSIAIEPENNPLNRQVLMPDDYYEKDIEYRFEKL